MAHALELSRVSRSFGSTRAVSDVSFHVERSEIFALVGPDGAGKTTLMRLICGALACGGGAITVDGIDVSREPSRVQAAIGYMPQRFSLYPDLSVSENLHFYGDIFSVPARDFIQRSAQLLGQFGLDGFEDRLAGDLSGGMKQKLALTCALIHSPATILLDEPTAGVDPLSRRAFWQILAQINAGGTTILVSTPYMDEAERAARVAFIAHGRILSCGTPVQLKAELDADIVEISGANRAAVRRVLHGAPIVRSIEVFGDTLHALVSSASQAIPLLQERLAEAGIAGAVLRKIAPSLEDTFVARMTS